MIDVLLNYGLCPIYFAVRKTEKEHLTLISTASKNVCHCLQEINCHWELKCIAMCR